MANKPGDEVLYAKGISHDMARVHFITKYNIKGSVHVREDGGGIYLREMTQEEVDETIQKLAVRSGGTDSVRVDNGPDILAGIDGVTG